MRPEQKAAFIMAQAACAFAKVASMQAVNLAQTAAGEPPPYRADDFDAVFGEFLITNQQVVKFFQENT